jgi:hypothetical protein
MAMQSTMNYKTVILLGISLLAFTIPIRAEDELPKEIPLFVTGQNFHGIDDRIFPLGWSAEGKFAWICKQSNEAADDCSWRVTIQDTNSNKILASEKFMMPDDPAHDIAQLWTAHGKAITELLEKHAVKRTPQAMDHFPLALGKLRGSVFLPVIETVTEKHKDLQFTGVKSFQVFKSSDDKKLPLFQRKYEDYVFPFSVAIAGCFVSPDEAHAAIVITSCWRGWEGAPHPRRIDALAGFKTGIGD